jgi:hypothetical protein
MVGIPRNLSEPSRFQVSVPKETFEYLTTLAKRGKLGGKEPDVAAFLIVRAVDEMLKSGYHDLTFKRD